MRVVLTAGAAPRLEGATDFMRFSLALDTTLDADRRVAVAPVAELDDSDHAWVRPDAVRAICTLAGMPDWEEGFAGMLRFAEKHGWIDTQGRIRAHIERCETLPAVDAHTFKSAMRRFASGVCVVASGEGAARRGMTVSAFSSVSAEPPMVLVCLNRNCGSHAHLTGAATYSINILGAEQTEVAMLFAGQRGRHGADRFSAEWRQAEQGAPVLTTALHSLICSSAAQYEAGSHTVLIGRVIAAHAGEGDAALVSFEGTLGATMRAA